MPKHEATDGWHSRGYLPHFDGPQITQFVTFRLADSMPQQLLEKWRAELQKESGIDADVILRRRIEVYLDQGYGECHLRNPAVAALVQISLLFFDGDRYKLWAWAVMPNHGHALMTPGAGHDLSKILQSLKSYSANEANKEHRNVPSKLRETKTGRLDVCAPGQTAPDKSWRLFIAIELPANVRKKLTDHIDRLRASVPGASASWSREENLHLTLKFLGDTPVAKAEALSQTAARAASAVHPFEILVRGCGAFPPRGQPRVLWVGIEDPSGQLGRLQTALEEECVGAGFAREQRPFHPHLTIARLRKPRGSRQLAELHKEIGFEAEPVGVSALAVVRSELRSEGSRHTVISRHEFAQT